MTDTEDVRSEPQGTNQQPQQQEKATTMQRETPSPVAAVPTLLDTIMCAVCLIQPVRIVLVPCGHIAVCGACIEKLVPARPHGSGGSGAESATDSSDVDSDDEGSLGGCKACPLCRTPIASTVRFFVCGNKQ
ncbi:hypothetical protein BC831DRAFT_466062 [Entophlyctis helioformis]|nr:hypothetical protein BC831DRAFT_466062 [Entophlyctis helioformis]